jgi:MFS family permease
MMSSPTDPPMSTPVDDPMTGSRRWLVLGLTCVALFGQFYAYDNPSTLSTALKSHFSRPGHEKEDALSFDMNFNLLYSLYSVPNIALPLFAGLAIDRWGIKFNVLFLTAFVVAGSFVSY